MDLLSKQELKMLAEHTTQPAVSIYLPTHAAGMETQGDPTRLKNLLRQAYEMLEARKLRTPEIDDLLQPGYRLMEDSLFWQDQSSGLAIFLASDIGSPQGVYLLITNSAAGYFFI